MPKKVTGDFEKYPEELREAMPFIYGEACHLMRLWKTFHYLFIESQIRSETAGKYLGHSLSLLGGLMSDDMLISLARLTDKDSRHQRNLSLFYLLERYSACLPEHADELRAKILNLNEKAEGLRKLRHKRIAHYDLPMSYTPELLPKVTFKEIRECVELLCDIVQFVARTSANTGIVFDIIDHREILGRTLATIKKAMLHDRLVEENRIKPTEFIHEEL